MKTKFDYSKVRAFTLKEVLVIIIILTIFILLFFSSTIPESKMKAQFVNCENNLKQIGIAFRLWSEDAMDGYPMKYQITNGGSQEYVASGSVFQHYKCMSNGLMTPKLLICPADERVPATNFSGLGNSNISYFVGVDTEEYTPHMFLTGDRNLATNEVAVSPGLLLLQSDVSVSWTSELHDRKGHVGLSDGSVQSLTSAKLRQLLSKTETNMNRLAIP